MSRHVPSPGILLLIAFALLTGCQPQQPFYFKHVDNELAYYKGVATEIEYPDADAQRLSEVSGDKRPWSLQNMDTKNIWDLTLEEATQIAMANSKVIRFINPGDTLSTGQVAINAAPEYLLGSSPDGVQTIYEPALRESDPGATGQPGVEAALSAFERAIEQQSDLGKSRHAPKRKPRFRIAWVPER